MASYLNEVERLRSSMEGNTRETITVWVIRREGWKVGKNFCPARGGCLYINGIYIPGVDIREFIEAQDSTVRRDLRFIWLA